MKYRGIEYTVVQGIDRGVWPWLASVTNLLIMGNALTDRRRWPQLSAPSKRFLRQLGGDFVRLMTRTCEAREV
jgi:hypothetical protein